jgi:hypothetical protein
MAAAVHSATASRTPNASLNDNPAAVAAALTTVGTAADALATTTVVSCRRGSRTLHDEASLS